MELKIRIPITVICLLFSLTLFATDDFSVSGLNEAQYVYKVAEDSLRNYFSDEFRFRLDYKNFSYGVSFIANLPKYDRFNPIYQLESDHIVYGWEDQYISYKTENFSALGGTFEESFGSGIVLRAFRDKELDIDTRLQGLSLKYSAKNLQIKALYGALPSESKYTYFDQGVEHEKDEYDIVTGVDVETDVAKFLTLGTNFAYFKFFPEFAIEEKHIHQEILGIRALCNLDYMDLTSEYAYLKKYNFILEPSKKGAAVYFHLNTYIGKFTISSAYKRYKNFDFRLNDLPTVNHSNEPLHKYLLPGKNEEGVMGEIRFVPDFSNEFVINYAEAWDRNLPEKSSLNDLYAKARHDFDNLSMTLEYSYLDVNNKASGFKNRKSTPSISFDFSVWELPIFIKAEYQYIKKTDGGETNSYYEPLLQTDIGYRNISLSLILQSSSRDWDDVWEQPFWLGGEIYANVLEHTELRLFVGKERGGEICRNGICQQYPMFKGVRLEITTSF